jgi:beta-lactam-binding protein with PASTA domain
MELIRVLSILGALVPILIIALSFRVKRIKKDKIKELELQKEILELELKNQEVKIKLLEEENKKLDEIINK